MNMGLGMIGGGANLYIYGAGEAGILLSEILLQNGVKVQGFIVTKGYKKACQVNKTAVYEYEIETHEMDGETINEKTILLTTKNNSHLIKKSLEEKGATVKDYSSGEAFCEIYTMYYRNILQKASYNGTEEEEIKFRDFSLLNPDKQSVGYRLSFYFEMADLLCPVLEEYCPDIEYSFNEGPYELNKVRLEQGNVVFDCGSNLGIFALNAARKGCWVYAFEPAPDNLKYLDFAADQFKDYIKVCPAALGDYKGTVEFEIEDTGTGCKIADLKKRKRGNTLDVPITSIDIFCAENHIANVDFIKADIEGAERLMLKGAFHTLKTMAPRLSICSYHLPDDKIVLEKLILDANPNYIIKHNYRKLYAYIPDK